MKTIKVSLSQEDIERAIKAAVVEFGLPTEGREMKITFSTTRKPASVNAEVEIAAPGIALESSVSEVTEESETVVNGTEPVPADSQEVNLPEPTPETTGHESPRPLFGGNQ